MPNAKDFTMIAVKRSTHSELKRLAAERGTTLADFIEDSVVNIRHDDTTGNLFLKLSRIENFLKDLDSENKKLNSYLSQINISKIPGVFLPLVPPRGRDVSYDTESDLETKAQHLDELSQIAQQDEVDRQTAIARGEDVVEKRNPHKKDK